jgi:hypothetical protein
MSPSPDPRLLALLVVSIAAGLLAGCTAESVPPDAVAATTSSSVRANAVPEVVTPSLGDSAPSTTPPEALHSIDPAPPVGIDHPPLPPAACGARAQEPSRSPAVAVHRWVDAAGITHYSDRAPAPGAADHRVLEVAGAPAISVEATGHDVGLPDQLQQRAVADALGVQRIMRDTLGIAAPHGLKLRVVFVRDEAEYARLVGEPSLSASAGAYSPARRTIYVRTQADDEQAFMVLRHELTHALVHESIGSLPTPLNEGLAEYFGRYRGGGLGGQIDVGAGHGAVAAAAPTGNGDEELVDLLAREDLAFYAAEGDATPVREQRYLRAYALVALLMRSGEGRRALAAVLHAQQADPCRPVVVEAILQREYPGGLQALAAAWSLSMRVPEVDVRAY